MQNDARQERIQDSAKASNKQQAGQASVKPKNSKAIDKDEELRKELQTPPKMIEEERHKDDGNGECDPISGHTAKVPTSKGKKIKLKDEETPREEDGEAEAKRKMQPEKSEADHEAEANAGLAP